MAFGVLLDTPLVRSLLVPALAYDLGGRIWWPGRLRTARPVGNREQDRELRAHESIAGLGRH
jgi:RND superfamily putative drug exporter